VGACEVSKCKNCDKLYTIVQQIKELNALSIEDIRVANSSKTPKLFMNPLKANLKFRAAYISDICDEVKRK
jgi:hypothetical protein